MPIHQGLYLSTNRINELRTELRQQREWDDGSGLVDEPNFISAVVVFSELFWSLGIQVQDIYTKILI